MTLRRQVNQLQLALVLGNALSAGRVERQSRCVRQRKFGVDADKRSGGSHAGAGRARTLSSTHFRRSISTHSFGRPVPGRIAVGSWSADFAWQRLPGRIHFPSKKARIYVVRWTMAGAAARTLARRHEPAAARSDRPSNIRPLGRWKL